MPRTSAGLIMYRVKAGTLQVLLVHPGGPFWKKKDDGAWSIPKGQVAPGEELIDCAKREFQEELGIAPDPEARFVPLGSIRQKSGKIVHAWAFKGDCDPACCKSNTMEMQWPPGSGKWITIPEVDRAEFFDVATATLKIIAAQAALLEELEKKVAG